MNLLDWLILLLFARFLFRPDAERARSNYCPPPPTRVPRGPVPPPPPGPKVLVSPRRRPSRRRLVDLAVGVGVPIRVEDSRGVGGRLVEAGSEEYRQLVEGWSR